MEDNRIPEVIEDNFSPIENKRLEAWMKLFRDNLGFRPMTDTIDPSSGEVFQCSEDLLPFKLDDVPYLNIEFSIGNKAYIDFIRTDSSWDDWLYDYIKKSPIPIDIDEINNDHINISSNTMSWEEVYHLAKKFLKFREGDLIPPIPDGLT